MEYFGPSGEHPSTGLPKLNLTCPGNWTKKIFFCKMPSVIIFWPFGNISLAVLTKLVKSNFLSEDFSFFEIEWYVWIFSGKISCKYSKLQSKSTCPDDLFQDYNFPWKKFPPNYFRNLNGELSAFPGNSSAWASKCTLHLQRMTLQRVYRF